MNTSIGLMDIDFDVDHRLMHMDYFLSNIMLNFDQMRMELNNYNRYVINIYF
ncbi:hypothetical protein M5D96_003794 [Drosophila gunungcola]|uniref:Uncharacterized protein n=1 Tax=Drosophila gunungcola TaxID=103775 RepID=A0A9P9YSX3_9MUSC|nr:hypothetical protein M5D96_003794 [Drosophila gunungcola]